MPTWTLSWTVTLYFCWRMHRNCQSVCIPLDSNLQMCCSPSYTATRQFGPNQPCSWLFKGFKPVGPTPQNKLFWNSQRRDCPSPSPGGGRLFQDVILLCPPVWAPIQWSCSTVNGTRGWKWSATDQEICSLSYMWPTYNQALLPTTDSTFTVVILVCFIC